MLYYGGVHMETIYEWLYENYYKPHAEEILDAYGDMGPVAEEAEQLLLAGEGDTIARQDAINALRRLNGTAAFAAGVCFGSRLLLDADFISSVALGGLSLTI